MKMLNHKNLLLWRLEGKCPTNLAEGNRNSVPRLNFHSPCVEKILLSHYFKIISYAFKYVAGIVKDEVLNTSV
jgi:hypothetical protein